MIKFIKTFTRPNANVEFFNAKTFMDQPSKIHMKTTYMDTGKMIPAEQQLSTDGLSLTTVVMFDTEQSLNEFKADSIIQASLLEARSLYNQANSITETTTVETV